LIWSYDPTARLTVHKKLIGLKHRNLVLRPNCSFNSSMAIHIAKRDVFFSMGLDPSPSRVVMGPQPILSRIAMDYQKIFWPKTRRVSRQPSPGSVATRDGCQNRSFHPFMGLTQKSRFLTISPNFKHHAKSIISIWLPKTISNIFMDKIHDFPGFDFR
jgi:hypothetical protein